MYQNMDNPLLNQDDSKKLGTIRKCLIALISIISAVLIFSFIAMIFSIKANSAAEKIPGYIEENTVPAKFVVDDSYILPPTDQMNLGTCWSFATIYLLESQYRHQGLTLGHLDKDEYVSFSKQAYFTWLSRKCNEHPEVKACHYGGIMANSSEDQEIESIYYFYNAWNDTGVSILPESVCPYHEKPEPTPAGWSYFDCPDLDQALKKNPLKFKLKSHSAAYNIPDSKKLLYKVKRPLGIGAPLPNMRYFIPCTGSPFENSTQCKSQQFRCPDTYAKQDFCYRLDVDARERDGIFLGRNDISHMAELGGHAMNIVGYNDEWVYRNRFQKTDSVPQMKGGLILHNSWRAPGHSVAYLMGNLSEENEAVICPNHNSPLNWIPATLECVQNNSNNPSLCSTDIKRVRGKGVAKGADILKCVSRDNHCNKSKTYLLGRIGSDAYVQQLPDGLDRIQMISIDTDGTVNAEYVEEVPFWAISSHFQPVNLVSNNPDQCGYWMMPYESLESMTRLNWDLLDNFRVFDFEVDFSLHSFAKIASPDLFDLSYLQNSTKKLNYTSFDGPLPYEHIY